MQAQLCKEKLNNQMSGWQQVSFTCLSAKLSLHCLLYKDGYGPFKYLCFASWINVKHFL